MTVSTHCDQAMRPNNTTTYRVVQELSQWPTWIRKAELFNCAPRTFATCWPIFKILSLDSGNSMQTSNKAIINSATTDYNLQLSLWNIFKGSTVCLNVSYVTSEYEFRQFSSYFSKIFKGSPHARDLLWITTSYWPSLWNKTRNTRMHNWNQTFRTSRWHRWRTHVAWRSSRRLYTCAIRNIVCISLLSHITACSRIW